ncbi:hypothetical protein L7F22_034689 [Adiantum nelumboides]|nr:hypothetical protein [Adiantum nelumboides]
MTRWVEAQSVASVNERTVSKFVYTHICCRFGTPLEIIFDNGPRFRKGLLTDVCDELHILHQHSTPYYPQSNGLVEKANGIIAGIIPKMVKNKTKLWDDFLDGALWAYQTTYKEAKDFTPFHLVYGQEAWQPIKLNIPTIQLHGKVAQGEEEAWADCLLTLAELEWKWEAAYECYKSKTTQVKDKLNKKVKDKGIKEGDLLLRKPEVASAVRTVHLEQFFRLPLWGTDYMRAHELMSSIQYDGKAMLMDSDGSKVEVFITKEIVNEALQLQPETYDLIPKKKAIDNEKAILKVKDNKFKYSNLIYSELELPLRLISQHFTVQKPPRYTEPLLHMAVVMALCVAERRQVRCDYAKFILETLIEANLKNFAKNKLYMSAEPMLTRIAYQALGMIEDLPAASSQAALIQQAKYVPKAVKTTSSAASSKSTRSRKGLSDDERTDTNKDQGSDESDREDILKRAEAKGPSKFERSDEKDHLTPLEEKIKKPRSRKQVLMDKAMARVEVRRKELADARAAKAAKTAKPTTMEEAKKQRLEKAKALQKKRKRLEVEEKAQEEAEAAQAAQTQEKEVIDLTGTVEYLKTIEREKHIAEQRAAQLAREKIKEALSKKAEEPILEPSQGSPKRPRQEDEEKMEHIQADPIPSSSQ